MSCAGVARIVRFNWPWYAGALAANAAGATLLAQGKAPWAAAAALGAADFWLTASLAVSHLIYDRSSLPRGAWLDGGGAPRRIGVFHAGHDEASQAVRARHPGAELQVFDFFDGSERASPSLARARAEADARARRASPEALPLEDGALDLACVVFAAHELRADAARAALFRELGRAVGPRGRILVVEHLRDAWNGLAYGPGAFHFLPRSAWERTFAAAGLRVETERRCTPFVTVFALELGA